MTTQYWQMTVPGQRKPSFLCEALVKDAERLKLKAYKPTPVDRWTVGYGETGPHIGPGTVWTKERAEASFSKRLGWFASGVDQLLGDTPISQPQFDALVSLAYNIGVSNFANSTLLKQLKAGRKPDSATGPAYQFLRWNKQKGKVLLGLVVRRWMERELFLLPLDKEYPSWFDGIEVIRPAVITSEMFG